jgi:branched-chain amino acid transport system permease protein
VWELYLNVIVGGLLIGVVYALIALGLTIMFGVMRIVNFAHGEMVVVGMYIGYMCWYWLGLPPLLAMPIAALLSFLLGYGLQRYLVSDFMSRPQYTQFILFIGIALLITGLHAMAFGPDPQNITDSSTFEVIRIGVLNLDLSRLQAATAAFAVIALLGAFLWLTPTGLAIRAAADNQIGAAAVGLRISDTFAITAGIGVACAGAAGSLIAPMFGAQPYLAAEFTLLAFITVIVGGVGSLRGALVGGLLIGVSESVAALVLSPSMKTMFSYALLFVIILLRPEGLFGTATR